MKTPDNHHSEMMASRMGASLIALLVCGVFTACNRADRNDVSEPPAMPAVTGTSASDAGVSEPAAPATSTGLAAPTTEPVPAPLETPTLPDDEHGPGRHDMEPLGQGAN
jgi:hypothetical protein